MVMSVLDPIVVDGALTETAWAQAPAVVDFLQYTPVDGGPPEGRTEVRFLQDDRALYVGIRVLDPGYAVRARISARERINADDQVGIYLDTFHDGRSGYIFYLNPLGIQQDIRHNSGDWNPNWDTAFRSAGHVIDDDGGYEIEIAFPWRSLKFPATEGPQTWGLILTRKVPHLGAKFAYPDISRNKPLLFSEEADLLGVDPPPRGSGLELIPTLTTSGQWAADPDTGAPPDLGQFDLDPWYEAIRPSLDLRLGLTPDLGLAATGNPDFSQVEGDLADVRLNARFAFQFTERRPFFLDGIDFFADGADTLYSRSIAEPIYGVKLSGREGPVSVGVLHALDRSPLPSVHEDGSPGFDDDDVADRWGTNSLVRLKLDAFGGGWVGLTAADKRIVASPARTGGAGVHDAVAVDVGLPFADRWIAQAATQSTWTSADGLDDPDPTPLWGLGQAFSIARNSGIGTGGGIFGNARSEGFRQEMGFLTQSGLFTATGWIDHTFTPSGAVDTYRPQLFASAFEENDGDHYRYAGTRQDLLVGGVHSLWIEGWVDHRRQSGADLMGYARPRRLVRPDRSAPRDQPLGERGPRSGLRHPGASGDRGAWARW